VELFIVCFSDMDRMYRLLTRTISGHGPLVELFIVCLLDMDRMYRLVARTISGLIYCLSFRHGPNVSFSCTDQEWSH